jgi:hypothetical protein
MMNEQKQRLIVAAVLSLQFLLQSSDAGKKTVILFIRHYLGETANAYFCLKISPKHLFYHFAMLSNMFCV